MADWAVSVGLITSVPGARRRNIGEVAVSADSVWSFGIGNPIVSLHDKLPEANTSSSLLGALNVNCSWKLLLHWLSGILLETNWVFRGDCFASKFYPSVHFISKCIGLRFGIRRTFSGGKAFLDLNRKALGGCVDGDPLTNSRLRTAVSEDLNRGSWIIWSRGHTLARLQVVVVITPVRSSYIPMRTRETIMLPKTGCVALWDHDRWDRVVISMTSFHHIPSIACCARICGAEETTGLSSAATVLESCHSSLFFWVILPHLKPVSTVIVTSFRGADMTSTGDTIFSVASTVKITEAVVDILATLVTGHLVQKVMVLQPVSLFAWTHSVT